MPSSPLARAVGDLEEDKAVTLVQDKLAKGEPALSILEELQDIHDFGKDIVATVMSSNGIKVIDLGVNVEHQAFVDSL